jgi:2-(1,2-epoxy-1,2-dihydrophenyl)acetyl-CoA isomerase
MTPSRLDVVFEDGVGRIRLTRPDAANTIDLDFAVELEAAAEACEANGARVVLFTSTGKQFCGGGDLKSFASESDLVGHLERVTRHLHAGIARLVEMDAPVVMAVQGPAAGAGVGLVCAADFVVASRSASFVMAYTRLGVTPDGSSSWFLPAHVGLRRALELTLTNRVLSSDEALSWGLVNRVVDDSRLLAEAEAIVAQLASGPTAAYGASARLLRSAARAQLRPHLQDETRTIGECAGHPDAREGITAFIERRSARFTER